MKNFKTGVIAATMILGALALQAQNGMPQVPNDAFMVMRISGASLQEKMPLEELNKLPVFQTMFEKGFRDSGISSIQELGIDFNKDSYVFAEYRDSVTYLSWMIPINSIGNFSNTVFREMRIDTEQGSPIYEQEMFIYWNEEAVVFSFATLSEKFKNENGLGWGGFGSMNYLEEYEIPVPAYEEPYEITEDVSEEYDRAEQEIVEVEPVEEPTEVKPKRESYSERKEREKGIVLGFHKARLARMQATIGKPVLSGKKFASVVASKADASAFLNYGMTGMGKGFLDFVAADVYGAMPGMMGMGAQTEMLKMSAGTTMLSELNFEDDAIRWNFDMNAGKQFSKIQKKMLSGKMSKKYLSYMSDDALIGYYTVNINTAATLDFYTQELAGWEDDGSEFGPIPSLVGEVLGLVLDEEEIAEFFPGSLAITFSDFGKRMVEYSTYEYDENMEKTKVTKEKEELMPVFLAMAETHKPGLVDKLMRLGTKGNRSPMTETEFGFVFNEGPMPIYFFTQDDMFFVGNDLVQLRSIKNGTFHSGLSLNHKKSIMKNNSVMFFDAKELMEEMAGAYPYGELAETIAFAQGKAKNMKITTGLKGGSTVQVEAVVEIPEYEENGWTYLMNIINSIYEYETGRYQN